MAQHPPRAAWAAFPDVILLAGEMAVKRYPGYSQAKSGNAIAARSLVDETGIAAVQELIAAVSEHGLPVLVSAHAYEHRGVNAIPSASANLLSEHIELQFETTVVQTNIVSHTGVNGGERSPIFGTIRCPIWGSDRVRNPSRGSLVR